MQTFRSILVIGIIELLIGGITLSATFVSMTLGINQKSDSVLVFVLITACISTLLGIGILKFNKLAYQLLLYFSSVIILSKLLLFCNIIEFNGALEQTIPQQAKDGISVLYHSFVIYVLKKNEIRQIFGV